MNAIELAVEDRFIVAKFSQKLIGYECPRILRDIIKIGFPQGYTILWDCRNIRSLTEETANGIVEICDAGISVICSEKNRDTIERTRQYTFNWATDETRERLNTRLLAVRNEEARFNYGRTPVKPFTEDFWSPDSPDSHEDLLTPLSEAEGRFLHYVLGGQAEDEIAEPDHLHTNPVLSLRALQDHVRRYAANSLLVEYVFQIGSNSALLTPYHSRAIHSIEAQDTLLLGRPAIIADRTAALLAAQLHEFELLIKQKDIREHEIQKFFERTPSIFKALGFAHVYPQVVLQRDDGTSLRPDFIVQPTSDEWCDIIDIKLPTMKTIVGARDRKTLSSAIHELIAQLREYSAYFEDEKLARRIEQQYGIKCYRPRLIGVVGSDPRLLDDRQTRRLMTAYSDVKVLTFDQMLKHARTRLLI